MYSTTWELLPVCGADFTSGVSGVSVSASSWVLVIAGKSRAGIVAVKVTEYRLESDRKSQILSIHHKGNILGQFECVDHRICRRSHRIRSADAVLSDAAGAGTGRDASEIRRIPGASALTADESAKDAIKLLKPPVLQTRVAFRDDAGSDYYFPVTDILYIESAGSGRRSIVHTTLAVIESKERLSDFENRYPKQFFRAHASYLINPMHVRIVTRRGVQLANGEEIPVPEKKSTRFKNDLKEWMQTFLA